MGKKVYYINPAIAWKGSKANIRKKTAMFMGEKFCGGTPNGVQLKETIGDG